VVFALLCFFGWERVDAAMPMSVPMPVLVEQMAANTDSPPQRSTVFDFASRITYTVDIHFDQNGAMTIEGWVYPEQNPEDTPGCQTFVRLGNDSWFGACPNLRFQHGGSFVEITVEPKKYRWTHVAVSYDGATATFYVNGEAAGSAPLSSGGNSVATMLEIGGSESAGNYYRGHMDEVRLWSVARTGDEIRSGMFQQVRSGNGLEAAFGDGGRNEEIHSVAGSPVGASQPATFGILPRDLVVPRAAITPTLDASVNTKVEYAGAEQVVVRYNYTGTPSGTIGVADLPLYLVRTDTDLFIGMPTMPKSVPLWTDETSWIAVMIDPNNSADPLAQLNDYQLRVYLNDAKDTPADAPAELYVGDGAGNWTLCTDPACPQRGVDWDADTRYDTSGEIDFGQFVEVRIAKTLLGEWTEVDGLALGQLGLGMPPQDFVGPVQAVQNSPLTWAQVAYSEGSAQLPRAVIQGRIFAGPDGSSPPLAGHTVVFGDINSAIFQRVTDANGEFAFDVRVPVNTQLRLQITECTNCRYNFPAVGDLGIQPIVTDDTFLFFPGCAANTTCTYADTYFFVRHPLGATIVNGSAPQARLKVNVAGDITPATTHVLTGENLHDLIRVYLSPVPDTNVTDIANWTLFEATVITRAADMKSMGVSIPTLDPRVPKQNGGPMVNTLGGNWRWVVKDDWQRPDNFNGFRVSGSFKLREPDYPMIYGFGFINKEDSAGLNEFLAVYGDNAYVCVGAFGLCLTHIPDPLYWTIWLPVFKIWIDQSGGSCVGMASTSLLFYHGNLNIANYSDTAFFPAGIKDRGAPAEWEYGTLGRVFGPPKAVNLWAEIRKNHGVQTSAEFLYEAVNQLNGFGGDPTQRLFFVRASPRDFVASMMKFGGGHAVTPYGASGNRIHIYDNNGPLTSGQFIDVDTSANTYNSSAGYSGTGLFTIDIDVWRGERSMPLDLPQIAMYLVFGDADALYSDGDGKQWGWQEDGEFVSEIPGATPFVPMGTVTDTHSVPLFVPITNAVVSNLQINTQGGDYVYYTGYGGNVVQLQVFDAPAGDQDQVEVKQDANQVNGFSYQPESASNHFVPKLGSDLGEQQRLLFRWGDLATPGGGKVGFTTDRAAKSADFTNNTGISTTHYLVVDSIDARVGIEEATTQRFGPFVVPNGATHRTTVANWPDGSQLLSEIDLDGDGVFETSTLVTGRACASEDLDENGMPDMCEWPGNVYVPSVVKEQ
jgi:hypothetical protein